MGLELLESVSIELESEPSKVSRKYMVRIGVSGGIHYYNAFQCIDFRSFCYVIGPNKSRFRWHVHYLLSREPVHIADQK